MVRLDKIFLGVQIIFVGDNVVVVADEIDKRDDGDDDETIVPLLFDVLAAIDCDDVEHDDDEQDENEEEWKNFERCDFLDLPWTLLLLLFLLLAIIESLSFFIDDDDENDGGGDDDVEVDGGGGDGVGELDAVFHIRILNASNMFVMYTPGSQILNNFYK